MRTYNKRIGFLVSYQTLIPHGGIGQFTLSFIRMMSNHNIKVDIITDKEPKDNEFISELRNVGANIVTPVESLPYTTHSSIFMYGDSFCYERMSNFRNAIIRALEQNIYDAFVCNTYETVQVASTMGLDDCIQIIAYTHLESQIFKDTKHNPFLHSVNEMMRHQLKMSNITIGTQSKSNELEFAYNVDYNNVYELPIPMTEPGLLKEYKKDREGVLFIGRWEEGKNPELYLELIEQTKLPARVMTNANGAKKFEDRLKKLGVDYKIAVSVIGEEKVDFITECRVAFNPSTVESYGMAFLEQLAQMPTVALEDMRWLSSFNKDWYHTCTKKNMAEVVTNLYNSPHTSNITAVVNRENSVFSKWNECLNDFEPKQSNSNTAAICKQTTVTHKDFISSLERKVICIDDVRSVLTNKHKFRVIYTDDDTYLTKDPSFEPGSVEESSALFGW